MPLQHARDRQTRGDVAARWLFVAACGAFALGGALASCASGGLGDGPGEDSGASGDVTPASQDSSDGKGHEDASSGTEAGALDGGGVPPRDASPEATDTGTPPPVDGSPQDSSSPVDASPVDASPADTSPADTSPADTSPADTSPPADTGGGTDASGTDGAVSCGGWPPWFAGTTAQQVQHLGERYTCIQPGWCDQSGTSAVLAWEPGVGSDWKAAWKDSGPCP